MVLIRNSAKCLECDTEIESVHRHDFKYCPCKAIAVDGGRAYRRRLWTDGKRWEDTSVYEGEDED